MVPVVTNPRYQLIRSLGRGRMGEVFLAEDVQLGRSVAVRFLSGTNPADTLRYLEGARASCRLDHPSFCPVYDLSSGAEGAYVAMSYMPGDSLDTRLKKGRPPEAWSTEVGYQIAEAIQSALAKGLVLQDLAAHNILVADLPGGGTLPRIADHLFTPVTHGQAANGGLNGLARILFRMYSGGDPGNAVAHGTLARYCPAGVAELIERLLNGGNGVRLPRAADLMTALAPRPEMATNATATVSILATPSSYTAEIPQEPWKESPVRYDDLAAIGEGGMGEVRRVRDRYLRRSLAMKILKSNEPSNRDRFLEEARITAQLQHPAIVPVHDIGALNDGRLYFTMKEIRGDTFERVIAETHARWEREAADGTDVADRNWSFNALVGALQRACEGVGYAHRYGVLHRDLKPSNLMVGDFGEVLVLDWGLTSSVRPLEDGVEATFSDTVLGTPVFMPPEQASGALSAITTRSDVYSLGAVLYTVLDGRPPYADQVRKVRLPVREGPPRPLGERPSAAPHGPGIPPDLKAICEKAMSREPSERYADGGELARTLAAWLEGAQRRERALEVVNEARAMRPRIQRLRAEAAELEEQAAQMSFAIPPFAAVESKLPIWEMQDKARALRADSDLAEMRFAQLVRGALTHAADFQPAHATLAEYYRDLHVQAEAARDRRTAAQLEILLRDHDDGRYGAYLGGTGSLTLSTEPAGARAMLYRYEEWDRRLIPRFVSNLGETPLLKVPLEMGSYLVKLSAPGRTEVKYPVFIERGTHWDGVRPGGSDSSPVLLPAREEIAAEECYIPAGWFWSGGDTAAKNGLPGRRLWLDAFAMTKHPVTMGEYIDFLNGLVASGRSEEAEQFCSPRPDWEEIGAHEKLSEPGIVRDGDRYRLEGAPEKMRWPATRLNWYAATAYAAWRAQTTGRPWRLVTEMEHEKAARGVDARSFPWGYFLDPTFCAMRYSHAARGIRSSVDEYPADESPYGVRGLAGNIHVWCADCYTPVGPDVIDGIPHPPDPAVVKGPGAGGVHRVLRGGSFLDPEEMCRTAYRDAPPAIFRETTIGIRLARSL